MPFSRVSEWVVTLRIPSQPRSPGSSRMEWDTLDGFFLPGGKGKSIRVLTIPKYFTKLIFFFRTELDIDSKKWRIRADILNDLAMGIDLFVLPLYPKVSTFILCATSTMKAIVGVAGGATRSALTQHHAIRGNLADVASKDSAQETCVNLVASFVGLGLLTHVQNQR